MMSSTFTTEVAHSSRCIVQMPKYNVSNVIQILSVGFSHIVNLEEYICYAQTVNRDNPWIVLAQTVNLRGLTLCADNPWIVPSTTCRAVAPIASGVPNRPSPMAACCISRRPAIMRKCCARYGHRKIEQRTPSCWDIEKNSRSL